MIVSAKTEHKAGEFIIKIIHLQSYNIEKNKKCNGRNILTSHEKNKFVCTETLSTNKEC